MAELRRQVAKPERIILVAPTLLAGVGVVFLVVMLITPFHGVFRPVSAVAVAFLVWVGFWRWSAREPHVETVLAEWARRLGFSGSGYPAASARNTWGLPGKHYER